MEILEDLFKTIPGLPFVFAIAALLLLKNDSEIAEVIRVFVVAWCLYQTSSYLDLLFDLFYAPKPKPDDGTLQWLIKFWWWRRRSRLPGLADLQKKRDDAAKSPGLLGTKVTYAKAKERAETSEAWKSEVYPLIGFSKIARTFILPFFLIGIRVKTSTGQQWLPQIVTVVDPLRSLSLFADFREDFVRAQERLKCLSSPAIPFGICLISLVIYIVLRLRHMGKLHELAASMPAKQQTEHPPQMVVRSTVDPNI